MKKFGHFIIVMVAAFFLMIPSAHAFKDSFVFDFVEQDSKLIKEPSGKIKISIEIPDEVDDPRVYAQLRDAALEAIEPIKNNIDKLVVSGDAQLKKLDKRAEKMALAKGGDEAFKWLEEQRSSWTKKINKVYTAWIANGEKAAKAAIDKKWDALKKKKKEWKKFKIKMKAGMTKGGFSVAGGVVRAVLTGGLDFTAYLSIARGINNIYENAYDLAKDEKQARDDIIKRLGNLQKRLNKKSFWSKALDKLKNPFPTSKLKKEITTYSAKLTGIDRQANKLAKEIDKLLNEQKKLMKQADKKTKKAMAALEKSTDSLLENVGDINKSIDTGKQFIKEGNELVNVAKKGDNTVQKALNELDDVIQKKFDKYDPKGKIRAGLSMSVSLLKLVKDFA
ncbi:MAG: hypothetical protein JEZ11_08075 [Desulfobacterales bacterium]|nr:hypothetical protein [Desulfobacterales bacterium]